MGVCTDATSLFSMLQDWSGSTPFDVVYCTYALQIGASVFATFVFGLLALMFYEHDESIVVPVVLALMWGSVIMAQLPGIAVQMAVAVVMIGVPVAFLFVIHRLRYRA